jgi:hypothetical protein
VDQRFIAETNQHPMVLEVKPTAKDIQTAFPGQVLFKGRSTRHLLGENLPAP